MYPQARPSPQNVRRKKKRRVSLCLVAPPNAQTGFLLATLDSPWSPFRPKHLRFFGWGPKDAREANRGISSETNPFRFVLKCQIFFVPKKQICREGRNFTPPVLYLLCFHVRFTRGLIQNAKGAQEEKGRVPEKKSRHLIIFIRSGFRKKLFFSLEPRWLV